MKFQLVQNPTGFGWAKGFVQRGNHHEYLSYLERLESLGLEVHRPNISFDEHNQFEYVEQLLPRAAVNGSKNMNKLLNILKLPFGRGGVVMDNDYTQSALGCKLMLLNELRLLHQYAVTEMRGGDGGLPLFLNPLLQSFVLLFQWF